MGFLDKFFGKSKKGEMPEGSVEHRIGDYLENDKSIEGTVNHDADVDNVYSTGSSGSVKVSNVSENQNESFNEAVKIEIEEDKPKKRGILKTFLLVLALALGFGVFDYFYKTDSEKTQDQNIAQSDKEEEGVKEEKEQIEKTDEASLEVKEEDNLEDLFKENEEKTENDNAESELQEQLLKEQKEDEEKALEKQRKEEERMAQEKALKEQKEAEEKALEEQRKEEERVAQEKALKEQKEAEEKKVETPVLVIKPLEGDNKVLQVKQSDTVPTEAETKLKERVANNTLMLSELSKQVYNALKLASEDIKILAKGQDKLKEKVFKEASEQEELKNRQIELERKVEELQKIIDELQRKQAMATCACEVKDNNVAKPKQVLKEKVAQPKNYISIVSANNGNKSDDKMEKDNQSMKKKGKFIVTDKSGKYEVMSIGANRDFAWVKTPNSKGIIVQLGDTFKGRTVAIINEKGLVDNNGEVIVEFATK